MEISQVNYWVNSNNTIYGNISGWVLGEYQEEEILTHGGDTFTTHTVITLSRDGNYGIYTSSTGGNKGEIPLYPVHQ